MLPFVADGDDHDCDYDGVQGDVKKPCHWPPLVEKMPDIP